MKKFYLALMAVAAIAFTSCGKDNGNNPNDPNKNQEETAKYASAEYKFTVTISEALSSVANMRLVYTGEDGKQTEETVMGYLTERVIKTNVPVDSIRVQVYFAKKEGADFTENNLFAEESAKGDKVMKLDFNFSGSYTTLDTKGNVIDRDLFLDAPHHVTTKLDKVENYVDSYSAAPRVSRLVRFDSKGYVIK